MSIILENYLELEKKLFLKVIIINLKIIEITIPRIK